MPPKRVQAVVKLQIVAGAATPAPPVGSALGPHGINIMEFCKQFTALTRSLLPTATITMRPQSSQSSTLFSSPILVRRPV